MARELHALSVELLGNHYHTLRLVGGVLHATPCLVSWTGVVLIFQGPEQHGLFVGAQLAVRPSTSIINDMPVVVDIDWLPFVQIIWLFQVNIAKTDFATIQFKKGRGRRLRPPREKAPTPAREGCSRCR